MSVYVITGASRGIGFGFVKQISEDSNNLVVGLVRDKAATEKKVAEELSGRSNIHIIHGDLADYASLKQAAAETDKIVGARGVDYLVASGAYMSFFDVYGPVGELTDDRALAEECSNLFQTNVVGNINLINLFVPLVLKSKVKKVITLSSGHADLDFINNLEVDTQPLYSAAKAAVNVIVAKYNAQYKKDGVLFLSISPGVVDVGQFAQSTPEQLEKLGGFMGKLAAYAPDFKGPSPVNDAVTAMRSTWEKASIEGGDGGAFVSHHGNKQWL